MLLGLSDPKKLTYTAPVGAVGQAQSGTFYSFSKGGKDYWYAPETNFGSVYFGRNASDIQVTEVPGTVADLFFGVKPAYQAGSNTGGSSFHPDPLAAEVQSFFGLSKTNRSDTTSYAGTSFSPASLSGKVYGSDPTASIRAQAKLNASGYDNYIRGLDNVILGVAGGVAAAYTGAGAVGGIAAQGGSQGAAVGATAGAAGATTGATGGLISASNAAAASASTGGGLAGTKTVGQTFGSGGTGAGGGLGGTSTVGQTFGATASQGLANSGGILETAKQIGSAVNKAYGVANDIGKAVAAGSSLFATVTGKKAGAAGAANGEANMDGLNLSAPPMNAGVAPPVQAGASSMMPMWALLAILGAIFLKG